MEFKVGDKVKLSKKFGIYNGVKEYPDYSQRGKVATIIEIDNDGYVVDVEGNGIYGAVGEEAVEQNMHPTELSLGEKI